MDSERLAKRLSKNEVRGVLWAVAKEKKRWKTLLKILLACLPARPLNFM